MCFAERLFGTGDEKNRPTFFRRVVRSRSYFKQIPHTSTCTCCNMRGSLYRRVLGTHENRCTRNTVLSPNTYVILTYYKWTSPWILCSVCRYLILFSYEGKAMKFSPIRYVAALYTILTFLTLFTHFIFIFYILFYSSSVALGIAKAFKFCRAIIEKTT